MAIFARREAIEVEPILWVFRKPTCVFARQDVVDTGDIAVRLLVLAVVVIP